MLKLAKENILGKKIDYALFSAGASVSKEFAPLFTDDEVNFCFSLLCEAGYYEAVGISGGLLS